MTLFDQTADSYRQRVRELSVLVICVMLSACGPPEHVESFGYLLEAEYAGVVPAAQQSALDDGLITRAEVEQAVTASLDCMAEIEGVVVDDPFHWREDGIEFGGGARPLPGTNEAVLVPMMDACYYEHVALVETAWFDQEYFGTFGYENVQQ
jgi:hypothetical protein